jgi:hypothetical protein
MAKDKKSFLIYCDLIHTVKKLSKEDAGELFLHMLEYTNDLEPQTENVIVDIVFESIKQQLKRDLKAYEKSLEDRSINGRMGNLKRWNTDLYNDVVSEVKTIEEAESIAIHRKSSPPDSKRSLTIASIAVKDNVNDNVSVNVNNNTLVPKLAVSVDKDLFKIDFDKLIIHFNEITGKKTRTIPKKAKDQFIKRLKEGYSKEDISTAINNCYNSDFHKTNGHKNLTLEFISREDKFAFYYDFKETKQNLKKQERL